MKTLLLLLLLVFTHDLQAQVKESAKFKLSSGFITAEAKPALHLQAGIEPVLGRWLLSVNFLDVGITSTQASGSRYRNETTSDGRTICRDTSNGQFANSGNCAADVETYFAFTGDVKYDISGGIKQVYVGAGYRLGRGKTPYGIISINPSENPNSLFYVDISGGHKFFAVTLLVRFDT